MLIKKIVSIDYSFNLLNDFRINDAMRTYFIADVGEESKNNCFISDGIDSTSKINKPDDSGVAGAGYGEIC